MAKSESKPKIARLPSAGVSAGLLDFLHEPGESALPPTDKGTSTGPPPENE